MYFNSIEFAIFLPIVFIVYWFVTSYNLKLQNFFVLAASYFFYGWWDWRFLSLIIISSLVDYSVGIAFSKTENTRKRKTLLWLSIFVNIGFLGFFKYYNFFVDNFVHAFTFFGNEINPNTLNIILPVGISFYTFQTLSYSIDVYYKKLEPTKNAIAFFAFVGFFPQLVAGPIERASNLLPQFYKKRVFKYEKATDGMRQILWGLFKKIVIADNCATYANDIFANYHDYSGSTLFLGAVFFAFQIYGDFSGYSDIAIGTARLFGFNLMQNFAFPYFSRDIAEFWRRWHISLSTWFRDYVYIPLGGSKGRTWLIIRNVFAIFLISGFWHGANWTFLIWGFLNALYFLPLMIFKQNRRNLKHINKQKLLPSFKEFLQIGATFLLTVLAWIFFRAENVTHAFLYLDRIFSSSILSTPEVMPAKVIILIALLMIVEWLQRDKLHALQIGNYPIPIYARWCFYYSLVLIIFIMGNFSSNYEFIYFQF